MCLLITRAPTSNMAPSALAELDLLLQLFEDAAPFSKPIAKFLVRRLSTNVVSWVTSRMSVVQESVAKLHRKAHESVGQIPPSFATTTLTPSELDRLGGKTHLLDADALESGKSSPRFFH